MAATVTSSVGILQYDLPVITVILLFYVGHVPHSVKFRQRSELKSETSQLSSKAQCEIRQNLGFTSGPPPGAGHQI